MPNVTYYVMTSWQNLPNKTSPIDATNLNHIEQGIKTVTDYINTLNAEAGIYLCGAPFTQALLTKLNGIEAQANKYVLPIAGTATLGGVKVDGSTITIDANGVITAAAAATTLESLTDVDLDNLEEGQILKWDATLSKWVNTSEAEVRTQLSLLEDVDIDDPQDGQTLRYNSTSEKWENGEAGDVLDYDDTLEELGGVPEPVDIDDWIKVGEVTGTTAISIPSTAKEILLIGTYETSYTVSAVLTLPLIANLLSSTARYFDTGGGSAGLFIRWGITDDQIVLNTANHNNSSIISSLKTALYYKH